MHHPPLDDVVDMNDLDWEIPVNSKAVKQAQTDLQHEYERLINAQQQGHNTSDLWDNVTHARHELTQALENNFEAYHKVLLIDAAQQDFKYTAPLYWVDLYESYPED